MIVTFDFDSTLSRVDVQEYARELISRGVSVWVLTSRYDELHKHRYPHNPTNQDLYKVTDSLGILRERIRFQCMRPKAEYLFSTNVIFHLDDDVVEIDQIREETNVGAVDVNKPYWKFFCEQYLKLKNPS